jgi:hypothetical protein
MANAASEEGSNGSSANLETQSRKHMDQEQGVLVKEHGMGSH